MDPAKNATPLPVPAEDAAIAAGIAADPEAREWTEDDFAQARPAAEALPAAVLAAFGGAWSMMISGLISLLSF